MTGFSVTTQVRASPSQVFWFLADPATAPVSDPAIVSYRPEGGTMGLGVRNHVHLRMLGVPARLVSETVVWEPGREMAFRSITPARPVTVDAAHRFEPSDAGTTYTWSIDVRPAGAGGRLAAAVAAALLRRNARAQQERVRAVLDAAHRPLPTTG